MPHSQIDILQQKSNKRDYKTHQIPVICIIIFIFCVFEMLPKMKIEMREEEKERKNNTESQKKKRRILRHLIFIAAFIFAFVAPYPFRTNICETALLY